MSLHAFIVHEETGDIHLIPIKEKDKHVPIDGVWCPCSPSADHMDKAPRLVSHFSIAARKWSRRLYQP